MKTRNCNKCGVEKEFENFHKCNSNREGIRPVCKKCVSEHGKSYRARISVSEKIYRPYKTCPRCKIEKFFEEFSRDRNTIDGRRVYCGQCQSDLAKLNNYWKETRKEKIYRPYKTCPKCKMEKCCEKFYRDKYSIDGRSTYCKGCQRKRKRSGRNRKNEEILNLIKNEKV